MGTEGRENPNLAMFMLLTLAPQSEQPDCMTGGVAPGATVVLCWLRTADAE